MKPDPTKPKKAGYVPAFFDPLFLFLRIRVDLIPEFVLESEKVVRGHVEVDGELFHRRSGRLYGSVFPVAYRRLGVAELERQFLLA